MAFKGFNSILFDFDSIVDKELSLIKFFIATYDKPQLDRIFNTTKIESNNNSTLKAQRISGSEGLFRSLLISDDLKNVSDNLINLFFERDQEEIFKNGYAFNTAMISLIMAYKKVGNGIIRTAVRCDNQYQVDYIKSISNDIVAFISDHKYVDTGKYGRIIVGHYSSALKYIFNEPKSIMVLNYIENFDANNNSLLKPELIISLGDIHKIEIISAFQNDNTIQG